MGGRSVSGSGQVREGGLRQRQQPGWCDWHAWPLAPATYITQAAAKSATARRCPRVPLTPLFSTLGGPLSRTVKGLDTAAVSPAPRRAPPSRARASSQPGHPSSTLKHLSKGGGPPTVWHWGLGSVAHLGGRLVSVVLHKQLAYAHVVQTQRHIHNLHRQRLPQHGGVLRGAAWHGTAQQKHGKSTTACQSM